jgi:hypothetical protein
MQKRRPEKDANISWKSLVQLRVSSVELSTVLVAVYDISSISCVKTNLIRKATGKLPMNFSGNTPSYCLNTTTCISNTTFQKLNVSVQSQIFTF